jgi:hypothetical protein
MPFEDHQWDSVRGSELQVGVCGRAVPRTSPARGMRRARARAAAFRRTAARGHHCYCSDQRQFRAQ